MKKLPFLLTLVLAFSLGSCASKGWNCSKRYCDASQKMPKTESSGSNNNVNV